MGKNAESYFQRADELGGLAAKIRLATLARITSVAAASEPDSPALESRLERAMQTVRAEYDPETHSRDERFGIIARLAPELETTTVLRSHVRTFLELMTQRALFLGDVEQTIRRIDEASASTLEIARVSVWFLDAQRTKITCKDLFELATGKHASGIELFEKDFPDYFRALESERTIAAHDAHHDPRTACFSASYLTPLGINSMLDVPIWVAGKMKGVICHEHVGPKRTWNADEESFGYLMSSFVALALERSA